LQTIVTHHGGGTEVDNVHAARDGVLHGQSLCVRPSFIVIKRQQHLVLQQQAGY